MSPRFVLGRENVPCVAEVVNRSLKADCTDFTPETGNRESVHHQLVQKRGEEQPLPSRNNHILAYNQGDYVEQKDTKDFMKNKFYLLSSLE